MTEETIHAGKEDQLVAALAHASALIPTFGLLVPLIVWITQKERSVYLREQALQATIWQSAAMLVQFIFFGCYFIGVFLLIPVGMLSESEPLSHTPVGGGALAAGFTLLVFLIILVFLVGGLVYLGFATAGFVQALRGVDFRYPLVGRWVMQRMESDEDAPSENTPENEPNN